MISYVSIAIREYAEGRICVSTDRMSGFLTRHGFGNVDFWREVLEWVGKKTPYENINVGVIESFPVYNLDYINTFKQVAYEKIKIEEILTRDLKDFDMLYFIGLPKNITNEILSVPSIIELYVRNGGGLLIEVPNNSQENVNILSGIDDVFCESFEPPIYTNSYWTEDGEFHPLYKDNTSLEFHSAIRADALSSGWTIIATNIERLSQPQSITGMIPTVSSASSEFSISYCSSFKNGIVIMEPMGDSPPT